MEVGKFGLEEEVERLKRDKNVLMQELVRLRQQQQSTDNQLQTMVQRLQGMEQRQQQMMSFLAKAVQSPGFLAQFVQQQNESNRRITEANKKRRLKQDGIGESEISAASGRQIVKYQPMTNEAMFRQIMKADTSGLDSFKNNPDGLLIRDGSASSTAIDNISASSRVSGVMLQEVLPTSGQTSCFTTSSGISIPATAISEIQSTPQSLTSEKVSTAPFLDMSMLVGAQEAPSIPISDGDVVMPELSQLPEMVPEGISSIPDYNFMVTEASDEFIDQTLGVNCPIDISSISTDPDIEALLESSTFWDDLIMQSPAPEQSSPDGMSKEIEQQPKENGFSKTQHVDELTEQMGLLASDSEGV